jgi:hypothetical protein
MIFRDTTKQQTSMVWWVTYGIWAIFLLHCHARLPTMAYRIEQNKAVASLSDDFDRTQVTRSRKP